MGIISLVSGANSSELQDELTCTRVCCLQIIWILYCIVLQMSL